MHYQLRITARADRDESCNLLTLTCTFDYGYEIPTPAQVKDTCHRVKNDFLDSWPHDRQAKPVLVPLDVEIFDFDVQHRHAPIEVG